MRDRHLCEDNIVGRIPQPRIETLRRLTGGEDDFADAVLAGVVFEG